jgi:D-amino peptidase
MRMRIYISIDMEGVAGVVHADQTRRGSEDYTTARELMTLEANAAALGAFDAGAEEVLINDSHGDMRNLVLEKLDRRVQTITGHLKPFSMVQGIRDARFDVAMFVGYHACAGTAEAILDHTYWGAVVSDMKVNGQIMNEAALNALVAGEAGTPIGLVSGDETACRQCRDIIGEMEIIPVKWAIGRYSARSLHPEEARDRIRKGAALCVGKAGSYKPFTLKAPYTLRIRMHQSAMVDSASVMPGTKRIDATTIEYPADTTTTLFNAMQAILRLGGEGLIR